MYAVSTTDQNPLFLSNNLSKAMNNGTNPKKTVALGKHSYHDKANSKPLKTPKNKGRFKNFNIYRLLSQHFQKKQL